MSTTTRDYNYFCSSILKLYVEDQTKQAKSKSFIELLKSLGFKINKTGKEFMLCCPFHNDKTPSLSVSDKKGLAYCFGCGWKGDQITFVQHFKNLLFKEAVEFINSV